MATRAEPLPSPVPSTPRETKTRLQRDRLAAALRKGNTAVYQRTIERHARALGYTNKVPRLADKAVLAGIRERSATSAASIVSTQQKRRAALVDEHGGKQAARPAYNAWHAGQQERIEGFEAGQTAAAAARDFAARNADVLQGEEWVEPGDSSGDSPCEDAIAQGRQPLNSIDPPPYHVACIHSLTREYLPLSQEDAASLWLGGDES